MPTKPRRFCLLGCLLSIHCFGCLHVDEATGSSTLRRNFFGHFEYPLLLLVLAERWVGKGR